MRIENRENNKIIFAFIMNILKAQIDLGF